MNITRLIAIRLKKRLAYLATLAQVIGRSYEHSTDPKERVRLSEVTQLVAEDRGVAVAFPFRRDVRQAARLLGFQRVTRAQRVARYVGMRKREEA